MRLRELFTEEDDPACCGVNFDAADFKPAVLGAAQYSSQNRLSEVPMSAHANDPT